jgi:pimeloyl-ACP methyl ester carboxylesterase
MTIQGEGSIALADGRRLATSRSGVGSTTVVAASGLGRSKEDWRHVEPLINTHAAVVAYDRAGYGSSDPRATPYDLDGMADDFLQLVHSVEGPVVLVGHSYGGPLVRRAAESLPPEKLKGVVLVDESVERLAQSATWVSRASVSLKYSRRVIAAAFSRPGNGERHPIHAARTALREAREFLPSLADLSLRSPDLSGVPATTISAKRSDPTLLREHEAAIASAESPRTVIADSDSHYLHHVSPELVADEIRRYL